MRRGLIVGCLAALLGGFGLTSWTTAADPPAVKVEVRRAETKPAEGLTEATIAGTTDKIYLHKEAVVTTEDIADARVIENANKAPAVEVVFTRKGQEKFAQATEDHKDKPLAILVNGKVISAPVIKGKITDKAMITGNFTKEAAEKLAASLKGK